MMYKSFKHLKTSLSTYTLSPKLNTWTHKLGFSGLSFGPPLILSSSALFAAIQKHEAFDEDITRLVQILLSSVVIDGGCLVRLAIPTTRQP
ncbi:hypothetical protein Hanom_Chr02g00121871 [Helianthus anomalus]